MLLNEKFDKAAIKQDVHQDETSFCYVCGKRTEAEGELCHSCAGIISTTLKSLYIDEEVC